MSKYNVDATVTVKISSLVVEPSEHYSETFEDSMKAEIEEVLSKHLNVNYAKTGAYIEEIFVNDVDTWNTI